MTSTIKRIAVIGPESTGKSTLCENLSVYYKTGWVKEYAREYLPVLNRPYTSSDIVYMYRKQFEYELKQLANAKKFLFTDTEFIIGKVWCEHVFGESPAYFADMIRQHPYDFYLLTSPDLPWAADPLRENPGKGIYFFELYRKILDETGKPYGIVKGSESERLNCALNILSEQFL